MRSRSQDRFLRDGYGSLERISVVYKIVETWKLLADSLRQVSVFLEDVILSSADAVKISGILLIAQDCYNVKV